ncbi:hypothetical protein [Enhygromyxa salina]|uniref:hypothetical protein n=1 Tax=Enhygromyxa salina TaxID=215803 RepID=UPI0011B2288B|nr:hypothetical protein [Enhygromyxa salina]
MDVEPSLRVRITPALEPDPSVAVHIELRGPAEPDEALRTWSLAGPLAGPVEVRAGDAKGPLRAVVEDSAGPSTGLRFSFDRTPTPPLELDYVLAPVAADRGRLARLALDDTHLFATGEALLFLPEGARDRRQTLAIDIDTGAFESSLGEDGVTGMPPLRAASSFAAAASTEFEGWAFELRRAAFVAGSLEWAEFESMQGDDRWLGIGLSRFDQRWSAAEVAGVRSAIDSDIGMPTPDPFVTILVSTMASADEASVLAELRGRGLVIAVGIHKVWDAAVRINTTQALVARWLGGVARVLEPGLEHADERALWFELGATRFVARELLYELGLLADEDYTAELDAIELELASSPVRELSLAELAELVAAADPELPASLQPAADARAQLAARGAMVMAWFDQQLVAQSEHGLTRIEEVLRMLVATAVSDQRRELSLDELLARVASKLSREQPPTAALRADFEAVVGAGRRPALAADVFGPCFRPRKGKTRRFELGFVDVTGPGDERPSVAALDPQGPAAKAGLRPDDRLLSLDYVLGDAEQPVRLTVERAGGPVELEYQPAGPSVRVVRWQRLAGVAPEACVR